ncbi:MAG: IS30 family transposase [bacterium]|jgi:IS30 family transposase
MIFKQKLGQTDVTSLVERVSRFTIILKNPDRRTKPVMGNMREPVDGADPPEHYHNIPLTEARCRLREAV